MKNILELTLQTRKIYYHFLNSTAKEELLKIPEGYRNNIWWNIAHVVVTQQALTYSLSGLPIKIPTELMDRYKKGSVPDGIATDEEIEQVKVLLFSKIEESIEDYENGLFVSFKEYTTSANVTLHNIDDAISFNLFHEGLHLGVVLSLQKALKI